MRLAGGRALRGASRQALPAKAARQGPLCRVRPRLGRHVLRAMPRGRQPRGQRAAGQGPHRGGRAPSPRSVGARRGQRALGPHAPAGSQCALRRAAHRSGRHARRDRDGLPRARPRAGHPAPPQPVRVRPHHPRSRRGGHPVGGRLPIRRRRRGVRQHRRRAHDLHPADGEVPRRRRADCGDGDRGAPAPNGALRRRGAEGRQRRLG